MRNIVFMGTPEFAATILTGITEAGYNVSGVVTQPDRPKGRKKLPVPCPVKETAVRKGLRVFQPEKLRHNETAKDEILNMNPDVIVVAAFGQIIPKEILDIPEYGCLNVHASILPAYRGAAPIQHAILDGRKTTGVTIMQMNEGLDTGDVIAEKETEIGAEETSGELSDRLAILGTKLLLEILPSVFAGTAVRTKQPEKSTTPYASMLSKSDGRIDWEKSAAYIHRQVRAMSPWPGAWTTLDGKVLRVWKAHEENSQEAAPKTLMTDGKTLLVSCGSGALAIDELQMEGKKRMSTQDFLRGYRLKALSVG